MGKCPKCKKELLSIRRDEWGDYDDPEISDVYYCLNCKKGYYTKGTYWNAPYKEGGEVTQEEIQNAIKRCVK